MFDDLSWNTAYDTARGNIFHDNGICSDDAVVAYGYASYDFGSGTNQHVVSNYGAFVAVVAYCHLLPILSAVMMVAKPCCIKKPPPICLVLMYRFVSPLIIHENKCDSLPTLK